ncbi:hypothetical protein NSU_0532 [Novosphingobium pentaromativorans US6-1]|uniref:Uncharacterized protein n=1 Tax=Novosphingobium pentaromativorans US6-1 TaxID=1088721 RepID=G6E861_9SPHN|nr:hypothetical protein NSU_0532 [Novosphingobium pentaromativorans US6-1]
MLGGNVAGFDDRFGACNISPVTLHDTITSIAVVHLQG